LVASLMTYTNLIAVSAMTRAARIISYVFHPIFMPTLGLALILHTGSYYDLTLKTDLKWGLYKIFLINTVAMPLVSLLLMKLSRMISSFEMHRREERTVPFVMILIYYGLTFYLLRNSDLPPLYASFLFGIMLALVLVTIINLFWKISVHMVGIAGLAGGFLAFVFKTGIEGLLPFILLVLATGLVGSSRLWLGAHETRQVYAGAVLGFAVEYLVISFEFSF